MKLSEYQNEEALDVLANIMEPLADIINDETVKSLYMDGKSKLLVAKHILKNHKKSVVEIVSALHGETPKTYKFNMFSLTKDFMELMDDPELATVFTSQGQT